MPDIDYGVHPANSKAGSTDVKKNKIDNYIKFCMALIVIGFSGIFAAAAIGIGPHLHAFLILCWGYACLLVTVYGVLSKSSKIVGYSMSITLLSFFIILAVIEIAGSYQPDLGRYLIYTFLLILGILCLIGTYLDKICWVQSDMYRQMLKEYLSEQARQDLEDEERK